MSGICKYMNGAKCAEEYCDFWDRDELRCSKAVECAEKAKFYKLINQHNEKALSLEESEPTEVDILEALRMIGPQTVH